MNSGIKFSSGVMMLNNRGRMLPVEVTDFTDVTTMMEETPPECDHYIPDSWWHDEICGEFNLNKPHFKAFQRIAWGWQAKGPIRKRLILRLRMKSSSGMTIFEAGDCRSYS